MKIKNILIIVTTSTALSACQVIVPPAPRGPHTVMGHSMSPYEAVVETTKVPYGDLQVGMTVEFYNLFSGGFVHHRLLRSTASGWVTKGDNNVRQDKGLMTERMYVGVTRIVEVLQE